MTKFSSLLSSIEFRANARTMVGNHAGSCLLHLTGAAITVKYMSGEEIASWPYNCIRQFRADEDSGQFSFYSGRRGPYGVAEYKFDMTDQILMELQDALTQFTGAQFGSHAGGAGDRNSTIDGRYQPDPTGWAVKQPSVSRSPKHAPLPEIPSTPPGSAEMFVGYSNAANPDNIQGQLSHSRRATLDLFATMPRDPHHRTAVTATGPPRPAPYSSRTIARDRISSSSQNKTPSPSMTQYRYHEPAGMAASPERGRGGRQVGHAPPPMPKPAGGRWTRAGNSSSSVDEVFMTQSPQSNGSMVGPSYFAAHHLTKRSTEPVFSTAATGRTHQYEDADLAERGATTTGGSGSAHYPTQRSHSFSPEPSNTAVPDQESSDLDFGPLKRSSPQVDRRKIPSIRGRTTPPNSGRAPPPHDLYSVPRPATSSSSSPPSGEALYNVPRPHSNGAHLPEQAHPPTTPRPEPENVYNVPRPAAASSDLYSVPRPQTENGEVEGSGSAFHSVSSQRPAVSSEQNGHELYNVPRPATEGSPPRQNGQDIYNVPRPATEGPVPLDNGLYNVPRSVDAPQPENLYNVPRPQETKRQSYDSLQSVRENVQQQTSTEQAPRGSVRYPASSRMVRPDPSRETYSVPRPANPRQSYMIQPNPSRNRYEDIDMDDPRLRGTPRLKPSRSLESLVHRRILPSERSTPQLHTRAHRTPSPRSHRYIELDMDTTTPAQGPTHNTPNPENLYAEIPDDTPPRRGSYPAQFNDAAQSNNSNYYTTIPSEGRMVIVMNSSPQGSRYITHNSTSSLSDKARALHEEGYELCLPADEVSRQKTSSVYHTPPRNVPRKSFVPGPMAHSYQTARDGFHRIGALNRVGEDTGVQLSSSGPVEPNPLSDEYVIVTHPDQHQPTQPRDIPMPQVRSHVPVSHSSSVPRVTPDEPYELMSSVQLQVRRQTGGSSSSAVPPPIPTKQRGSVSSGTGPMSNRTSASHLRDSLDLDNMSMSETGSVVSTGSSNRLCDLEGQLSPTGVDEAPRTASLSNPQTVPPKKNLIRIASGSPHDITPSKDLRSRSLSLGNMLDEAKPQKYVNVSDQELAAKQAANQPFKGSKKHPMPLPKPCRAEN